MCCFVFKMFNTIGKLTVCSSLLPLYANGWIWQSQRLRNAGNSYDGYNKGNIYWIGRLCCQQNPKSCMQWGKHTAVFDLYWNYDATAFFFPVPFDVVAVVIACYERRHLRYLVLFLAVHFYSVFCISWLCCVLILPHFFYSSI